MRLWIPVKLDTLVPWTKLPRPWRERKITNILLARAVDGCITQMDAIKSLYHTAPSWILYVPHILWTQIAILEMLSRVLLGLQAKMSGVIWIIAIEHHGSVLQCYINSPDNLQFTCHKQHILKIKGSFVYYNISFHLLSVYQWYFTLIPLDGTEGDKNACKQYQKFNIAFKSDNGFFVQATAEISGKYGLVFSLDIFVIKAIS